MLTVTTRLIADPQRVNMGLANKKRCSPPTSQREER